MNVDMDQFLSAFLVEAQEHIEVFESTLLAVEDDPSNREQLNTIFRCAHSIKGGAATFGLPGVAGFTHHVETLLDDIRAGKIQLTTTISRLLFQCLDEIRLLLASPNGAVPELSDSAKNLVSQLQIASNYSSDEASSVQLEAASGLLEYEFLFQPKADILARGCDPFLPLLELEEVCTNYSVKADTSRVPSLEDFDPEQCYLSWKGQIATEHSANEIREIFDFVADTEDIDLFPIQQNVHTAQKEVTGNSGGSTNPSFRPDAGIIRVSSDKMDRLVNLIGELVINQSILDAVVADFTPNQMGNLIDAVASMARACRELQERVMSIRLVPLRQAFGRFPRVVHDLSNSLGKQVELTMSGEDTELDKALVEAICDPLTHLIRNSVDHGLESESERVATGKSPVGHLHVNASHEGGSVMLEVTDDGKGLDKDKILAKAIDRGLVQAGTAMTDEAIHALIFAPGFSTADAITDVSGRGVGMDIVRSTIDNLNGNVSVYSNPGQGTRVRIRLPLTMAILEGLSLSIGEEIYVLPLTAIVESIQPKKEDLVTITGDEEVVRVRGEVLPVVRLHQLFNSPSYISDPSKGLLVIVSDDERKVALLVDELIGQNQVVIKSMEANYRKVEGVAGATILGDGRVALILDVPELVRCADAAARAA